MEENGWNLEQINKELRLVLPGENCDWNLLTKINEFNWIVEGWSNSMIFTTFWGYGKAELKFGNCNHDGEVSVVVDGKEITNSKPNGKETIATFNVAEGSNLTIKADNRAIIKLFGLKIECGKY